MNISTIRVPSPFARVLLDDLREWPFDEAEDAPITDPEQIAADTALDASVEGWVNELDGEGERSLSVPHGPPAEWFADYLRGAMLEGLASRLEDGSLVERKAVVQAIDGWTEVVSQLDEPAGSGGVRLEEWLCPVCGAVIRDDLLSDYHKGDPPRPPVHEHYGRVVAMVERAQ